MPYDELVIRAGNTGGAVFANKTNRRCCIIVDEEASKKEAQDTIKWAREALESGNLELTPWEAFLKIFGMEGYAHE